MDKEEIIRRLKNERKKQRRKVDKINPRIEGLIAEAEEISQYDLAKGRIEALSFAIDLITNPGLKNPLMK